ncbi:hypothetical protein LWM68_20245 [Niabella sp. W65]|nr:hypothetical protein [Niabella sp. W65]MCH7364887.1 hypothetical protein [Niabella sp. W65]ULT40721.1 hypothetical protein KRR40_39170 [Niabella sp. I65]
MGVDPLADYYGQDRYSPYAAMGNQPESMVDPNGMAFGPPPVFTRVTNRGEQWGMSTTGISPSSIHFMLHGLDNTPFISIPTFGEDRVRR